MLECPDCGRPANECSDPERTWFPYRRICYPTMVRQMAAGLYEKLHEKAPFHDGSFQSWAKDRSEKHPFHFNDGVTIGVADRDPVPWDEFTTKVLASPTRPSVSEQSPGEQDQATEGAAE